MSSLSIAKWCGECRTTIPPNSNGPPCHLRHSGGRGLSATGEFCHACNATHYSNLPLTLAQKERHQRSMLRSKQNKWNGMINAEKEPKGAVKIVDKGNYVATGGIFPNEMAVVHEKIAHRLAEKRSNQK